MEVEYDLGEQTSQVYPVRNSDLKKNAFVILNDSRPCEIVGISQTGDMVDLVGIDVFTGERFEESHPSTDNSTVVEVKRSDYELLDLDEGYVTLALKGGRTRPGVQLPPDPELAKKIEDAWEKMEGTTIITLIEALGEELIVDCKTS